MKKLFYSLMALVLTINASAAVTIQEQQGWFETAFVTWTNTPGMTYTVFVRPQGGSYTQLDNELVRNYGTYGRADALGLAAGNYQLKVVASNGDEAETGVLAVQAHDRNGFAHQGRAEGVGAYNNDGTLKTNARILYVTANNAKTVTLDMQVDSKGKIETRTGLQNIIQAYEKGQEKRPLAVRIIGTIKNANMDAFGSSAEGLQVKGNGSAKCIANLTIEGVGNDATIYGFGILCRSISSVEFRNFAIMICLDDCLSLDTDNKNIWIHNMDFFYGGTGGDADQAKGDGTVDIKGGSSHVTVSYNHFFDSGKCSLGGMKSETTNCWMTYHHNWFDHSDSRHPRIRTAFYHVYNNYFDGNAKYGVGVTSGGSSFVEKNYFRNCKYPMLISKQGTDAEGDGTFSGENGGVIKAYDNLLIHPKQVLYYTAGQTNGKWDAVLVTNRAEAVTATAFAGGTSYNSSADAQARAAVPETAMDDAQNVALICRGEFAGRFGAGRCQGGDFKWTFNYVVQDPNYAVITDLKSTLLTYQSTLVGLYTGQTSIANGGGTLVNAGDGVGMTQPIDASTNVPAWGGDVPEEPDFEEEPYIASPDGKDFYFFGEHVDDTNAYITNGIIVLAPAADATQTSSFDPTYTNITYKKDAQGNPTSEIQCQTEKTGSLQLGKASTAGTYNGGSVTFCCPKGVTSFKVYSYRTGSCYYKVEKSTNGSTFTEVAKVEKAATGIVEKDFTSLLRNRESTDSVWVRIVNGSTGGLNIQGILINQLSSSVTPLEESDLTMVAEPQSLNIGATFQLVQGTSFTTSSTGAISYSSSNANVASVNASGLITAISAGTANIIVAQAKDETYKAKSVTLSVTVVDPRSESSFALTSNETVSVKEGQTSQIVTTGNAGTVTYQSNNTSVATVDASGLISAVAAGTAVISISDPGSETVQGKTLTVTVTVTADMTGVTICYFTASSKSASSNMVTVSGNYSNSKGTVTYNGTEYTDCVKMESATDITITPSANCTVTLVFGSTEGGKKFKLDGVDKTTDSKGMYSFSAVGGTAYHVTKNASINLFLVIFTPISTGFESAIEGQKAVKIVRDGRVLIQRGEQMFTIDGRRVK